ncbi:MAG TPA: bifunctional phosphopantothenoylcysteine decarboxylase/phosphopantothenate--cysteine ligase CoaBC, partial [Flavisolibacter sp.]|nr:bifunctional phosphopantothenoylcysteine decarboxylase/phosphopantothenate--cysteine ligase CoaBC [Flavisolibacter sp.]
MLAGKKILIGISGSIAAYKIPILVRLLIKEGAEVKVVMTEAAKDFVSKLTLSTLSKSLVLDTLFDETAWANHVILGRWADIMLVAPLSCNTLSKMATGACDNLLMAIYLSATCPVVAAPAMDEDMWHHPTTKQNLNTLKANGNYIIPAEHGELASGLIGEGRMAEPESILQFLNDFFNVQHSLKGKKALITAGPTYEAIDPVRFIGNHSSGKMGYAIAGELAKRGAEVILVSGPVSQSVPAGNIRVIHTVSASDMFEACMQYQDSDIAVMSAAVADFTPVEVASQKIKKGEGEMQIQLRKTEDILAALGKHKNANQLLVGFALETENEEINALKKLKNKNADLIIL